MEGITVKDLTFTYPKQRNAALKSIFLSVNQGEFVTLCGKSGCGKSTLLRHFRSTLMPHGKREGAVYFGNKQIDQLSQREQTEKIGFVHQSPDNQIVTDKVWHELAFGLESLGYSTSEIRGRVSEMASFFGIQTWFHKKVTELSGGQKQLLNLASIMAMQPSVLVLDEPTSQLDPIAATDFLETIKKINRELGTTIILVEHRLEDAMPLSDRVIVMDNGDIIVDDTPSMVGEKLKEFNHDMFVAMPTPMRIYGKVDNDLTCPITVRDGRHWITEFAKNRPLNKDAIPKDCKTDLSNPIIEMDEVWFRYERELPDVVKGLSITINKGELFAIVGGNGTGKTTSLSIMSGILKPYRGTVNINGNLGALPQNPQALFVKKTVELDLYEMFSGRKIPRDEQERRIMAVSELCELTDLLHMHPYDLSGGEQQRAALAKVLLMTPKILLLDEPTKGLDGHFKEKLGDILRRLQKDGVTIIMVSHDIEFCASYATRCAMFFDGNITSIGTPRTFFGGKNFYTTATNRMARTVLPEAIIPEDVILACGGKIQSKKHLSKEYDEDGLFSETNIKKIDNNDKVSPKSSYSSHFCFTPVRISISVLCLLAFILTTVFLWGKYTDWRDYIVQLILVLELAVGLAVIMPGKDLDMPDFSVQVPKEKRILSKRTIVAMATVLLAAPLTIYIGVYFLGDKKYYFISLLIILETILPFAFIFESRKPQARELVIIAVLCAIGVAGRAAFFMLPQFKPVVAVVIISGVCFGGETGFLVGAVTAFTSNMLFGQGTWTPWQMFAFGITGFIAGILFRKGFLRKKRSSLCIFGALTTFFICGFVLDTGAALMWQANPTLESMITYYLMGIPFNIIHAAATTFFLWFGAEPMIEKLDRIKIKYGLVEI
ncbi:energy-coupling factor transporter ATPase [Clostridiisalibacter paucivorans]|uniref:energy-coupling factor transporter ATPase n=1 Tax=Clostridiisalibacter paucivorans TaxID=408753 RepID=UPI0004788FC7|nr:energy-coupling factor transporter ATPase [Clostridiisalibacter paucivorans]